MDNLGDYIYLVLLVIAGLTSLLGKRKKSEARKQRPVVLSEKSWEERMRDLSRKPIAKDEEPEETGTMVEPEEFEYKMPERRTSTESYGDSCYFPKFEAAWRCRRSTYQGGEHRRLGKRLREFG